MTALQQRNILELLFHSTGGKEYWTQSWPVHEDPGGKSFITNNNMSTENKANLNDVCEWYGIECREVTTNAFGSKAEMEKELVITGINLTSNNLIGFVPWEIFHLPDLRRISLSSNSIQEIDLKAKCDYNVSMSSNLPSDIKEDILEKYTSIFSLDSQKIEEVRSHITDIDILRSPSDSIVKLDLSRNNITCYDLRALARFLPKLQHIDFSMNKLRGRVPDFADFAHLHTINFTSTELIGSIPSSFLLASRIQYTRDKEFTVDLSQNKISGTIPSEFKQFYHLNLYLQDNQITHIPVNICDQFEWMQGDVGIFGCDAILCPPNHINVYGRQKKTNSKCTLCANTDRLSTFYGQTDCGNRDESDEEENEPIWTKLLNRRFWGFCSLFVIILAGVLTFTEE